MLRYPQPLGCIRGGEGLSDMRSLLLRETVINESRNCSFMVRRGMGGWEEDKQPCDFILILD